MALVRRERDSCTVHSRWVRWHAQAVKRRMLTHLLLGAGEEECAGPGNMRVRTMPVISPDEVYGTGSDVYGVVSQMICVWIDKVAQNPSADPSTVSGSPGRRNVYVRVYDGCGGDGEGTGEFLWDLRLVE